LPPFSWTTASQRDPGAAVHGSRLTGQRGSCRPCEVGAQFGIHAAAAVVLHDAVDRLTATQGGQKTAPDRRVAVVASVFAFFHDDRMCPVMMDSHIILNGCPWSGPLILMGEIRGDGIFSRLSGRKEGCSIPLKPSLSVEDPAGFQGNKAAVRCALRSYSRAFQGTPCKSGRPRGSPRRRPSGSRRIDTRRSWPGGRSRRGPR
jgi:hypothetical protein